jgi:hypothetical protein
MVAGGGALVVVVVVVVVLAADGGERECVWEAWSNAPIQPSPSTSYKHTHHSSCSDFT